MLERIRFQICAALMLLAAVAPAFAQTRGTVSGYVRDASGALVPGAAITLNHENTGSRRQTTADQEGYYQFLGLVSGRYSVEAEAKGFKKVANTGLELTADQNLRADISMEIGAVTETVDVSASAAVVDTRSATLASTINDRRIVELPLSGRNVIALASLLPGVTQVSSPSNSDVTHARGGSTMTVNGSRANQSYYTLNGTFFTNPSRNTGLNVPPPDAVQELRIQTSNFTAESGRNAGAIVSVVTRAGTNDFHGALWEFHRNSALNARNFFLPRKPSERQNQFGATAGGPIRRDKLFVFGAYEGVFDRRAASEVSAFPPTAAERSGDFSNLSRQLVDPFTGAPFPGNQIPASRIDPVAQKVLEFVPLPPPGGMLAAISPAPRDGHLGMTRADWNVSDRQSLFVHYYLNQNRLEAEALDFGSNIAGWMGRSQRVRNQNAGLNHTYVFSPTLLNQVTLGYTRSVSSDLPSTTRTNAELGMRGFPDYTNGGAAQFRVTGRLNLNSGGPVKFISNNYDINETLSWTKGRHTLRFGFQYLDLGFFQSFLGPATFTFNGTRTGDAFADFLTGAYRTLAFGYGVRNNDGLSGYYGAFFQDDFKVTPRLTLNFGLRYEVMQPWVDKADRINTVDTTPGAQSRVVPNAPPGLLFVGDLPRGLVETDRNNFGPRFGFAWDVLGDGRTAVRGGYGIFYEMLNADTVAQENPPFAGSTSYVNGRLVEPAAGQVLPPVVPDPTNTGFVYPINNFFVDLTLRTPYVQQWNFSVERQVGSDISVQGSYVGRVGHKLAAYRPFNAAIYVPGTDANGRPLSTLENAGQRAPFYPGIYGTQMLALSGAFNQSYHGAQLRVDKRFSNNFSVLASYTLGKAIDDSSTTTLGGCVSNPYDLRSERGRAQFDARHALSVSWFYTPLPARRGWFGALFGGWNTSGIHRVRSGYPLTFYNGDDVALAMDICNGSEQHPDLIADPAREHESRGDMITRFFNTGAFRRPQTGTYGSAGRNILSGPAFVTSDLALLKNFVVAGETRLEFRAELFNAFNQVNFTRVRTTMTDPNFGRIDQAAPGRTIQLALKYVW
ncbi:MAG TPA: carboxypeptidase regulatory-like domain-containing protein [Bryobacteraceae bacterium]|nr:carboxypeptidase regulatory-like domain-containing protein [Bryobacteraceae bacterium]